MAEPGPITTRRPCVRRWAFVHARDGFVRELDGEMTRAAAQAVVARDNAGRRRGDRFECVPLARCGDRAAAPAATPRDADALLAEHARRGGAPGDTYLELRRARVEQGAAAHGAAAAGLWMQRGQDERA